MQVLKEEVRQKILQAAVEEFGASGYREASMRQIAGRSGITAGNIYRYFENKEALFCCVMDPIWQEILHLIYIDKEMGNPQNLNTLSVSYIVSHIIDICKEHADQFCILIAKSGGSPYADAKERLVNVVKKRLDEELIPALRQLNGQEQDPLLSQVLAATIIDSFFSIIVECRDDIPRMGRLMQLMLVILFQDLDKRTGPPH